MIARDCHSVHSRDTFCLSQIIKGSHETEIILSPRITYIYGLISFRFFFGLPLSWRCNHFLMRYHFIIRPVFSLLISTLFSILSNITFVFELYPNTRCLHSYKCCPWVKLILTTYFVDKECVSWCCKVLRSLELIVTITDRCYEFHHYLNVSHVQFLRLFSFWSVPF